MVPIGILSYITDWATHESNFGREWLSNVYKSVDGRKQRKTHKLNLFKVVESEWEIIPRYKWNDQMKLG